MQTATYLFAGYAVALVAGAFVLEWLSVLTHRRSLAYRTAGFDYDEHHDRWTCPEGEHLWPHEYDHERRFVRYRAKAAICNGCPRNSACMAEGLGGGREVARPIDPWPHSEAGRFHRGIAVLMVVIALLLLIVGLVRSGGALDAVLLGALAAVTTAALVFLARDLTRHPAGFPDPTAGTGLRVAQVGADGVRSPSAWGSQRPALEPDRRWASRRRRRRIGTWDEWEDG